MTKTRYINASQVSWYQARGWVCSLMAGHHGTEGRFIAVRFASFAPHRVTVKQRSARKHG